MPNLLVIMSDEHRRDALGCMGHDIVKTPNLDALARSGTLFDNAYTPSPMCVPARAAIATGLYVHQTRHWDSATAYAGEPQSWMHDLRRQGVRTASIGKLHFRRDGEDHGFDEEILAMQIVDGIGWPIGLLREDPPPYDGTAGFAQEVGSGESEYTRYDRNITEAAEAWLGSASVDQPWALFVSFICPHYPLIAPEPFHKLYENVEMDLPFAYSEDERPNHPEIRRLTDFFDYDRHFDQARIRQAKAGYYGLVSFMDDCVGRVLRALELRGAADRTTVIYASDHGDMMGDHGIWTKQVMYEGSVGVPMILRGPGVPKAQRCSNGASLIDIAATARSIFGVEKGEGPSDPAAGHSLLDLASKPQPARTIFSEYHDGGSSTGTFMVRWDRFKYVHYEGMRPQLFDLAADPQERNELHDPALLAEGDARLRSICDPSAVNARCFDDQARKIEALGGREAILAIEAFGHTPAPT